MQRVSKEYITRNRIKRSENKTHVTMKKRKIKYLVIWWTSCLMSFPLIRPKCHYEPLNKEGSNRQAKGTMRFRNINLAISSEMV